MDTNTLAALLHAVGLDNALPVILAVMTLARALDALVKQPAPGSHWIPMRKLMSIISLSIGHAKPGEQPAFVTWLQRLAVTLAQALPPPPAPVAPAPAPVAPVPPAQPAPAPAPAAPAAPAVSTSRADRLPTVEQARNTIGAPPADAIRFRQP